MKNRDAVFPKETPWPWLIIGLAVLIYGYSLSDGLIWDDQHYVLMKAPVSPWTELKNIWLHNSQVAEYYPATSTGFLLQYQLWGSNPYGYHIVSLVLHILNALLLFGLLRKRAPRLAGITALLFTIHPVQVETGAWVSQLKTAASVTVELVLV